MSVVLPAEGEVFTVRTHKTLSSNPSLFWANTYEVRAESDLGDTSVFLLGNGIVEFERKIHLDDVVFDRVVVSTWVPDGTPYDPLSFVAYTVSGPGLVSTVGQDPASLNNCLFVRRSVTAGRTGKLFYRRCLLESDITAPAGTVSLALASPVWERVIDAQGEDYMADLIGGGGDFKMIMKADDQPDRLVSGLVPAGARMIQYNNRYFDVP